MRICIYICLRLPFTPTVAMARRATLARFFKKRMHCLTCTNTSNLPTKAPDATSSEASNNRSRCWHLDNVFFANEDPNSTWRTQYPSCLLIGVISLRIRLYIK